MRVMRSAISMIALVTTAIVSPGRSCPPEESSTSPLAPVEPVVASNPTEAPQRPKPPVGLLTPITENGGLPIIYNKMYDLTEDELRYRAKVRQYAKQIRKIRHEYFGEVRVDRVRQQGMERLGEFTDPAAFRPMIEELEREKDDVRLAMLDHFANHSDEGQTALGWVAIYDESAAMRHEATKRMVSPAAEGVKYLVNGALRSPKATVCNSAALLASSLNIIEAIPLLIFAQATGTASDQQGDIAWIAIQTQQAFVAGLVPVVGDNSGAFQPIIGVISDGVVMRVHDAIVIEYRTLVHNSLVAMTTNDWGQPTEYMSYNVKAWWDWYNSQYVPFKNEQAAAAALAGSAGS